MKVTTLYRPLNIDELRLIEASGWKKFPPRLFHQPIFYPVMNLKYARQITKEWNLPTYGNGFVVSFDVESKYLEKFQIEKVGLDHHLELWIPSEMLKEFNSKIIGKIDVVEGFSTFNNKCFFYAEDKFNLLNNWKIVVGRILDDGYTPDISQLHKLGEFELKPTVRLIRKNNDFKQKFKTIGLLLNNEIILENVLVDRVYEIVVLNK